MNVKKMRFMITTKDLINIHHKNKKPTLNNTAIEKIYSYKYLGIWININGDVSKEIRCRIEFATTGFFKMKNCFSNRVLLIEVRKRMLMCYELSMLMCEVET